MHEYGWEADLVKYDVLLMYPKVEEGRPYAELTARCEPDRGDCAGMGPSGDSFTARLEEEVYAEDDLGDRGPEDNPAPWGTSQLPLQVPLKGVELQMTARRLKKEKMK